MTVTLHLTCGCTLSRTVDPSPTARAVMTAALEGAIGARYPEGHTCENPDPPRPLRLVAVEINAAPVVPCRSFHLGVEGRA